MAGVLPASRDPPQTPPGMSRQNLQMPQEQAWSTENLYHKVGSQPVKYKTFTKMSTKKDPEINSQITKTNSKKINKTDLLTIWLIKPFWILFHTFQGTNTFSLQFFPSKNIIILVQLSIHYNAVMVSAI